MNLPLDSLVQTQTGQIPGASVAIRASTSSEASGSPASAKLRKAAGEFESILLESLWKSMKETFKDPDDEESFDGTLETFDDLGMQSMASAVGNSGGLGIKNMILKYLEPRLNDGAGHAAQAR